MSSNRAAGHAGRLTDFPSAVSDLLLRQLCASDTTCFLTEDGDGEAAHVLGEVR